MKSDISVIPLNVVKNNVALFERKTIESSNESNSIRFKSNPIRFRNNFINESTIQQRSVGNKSLVDYNYRFERCFSENIENDFIEISSTNKSILFQYQNNKMDQFEERADHKNVSQKSLLNFNFDKQISNDETSTRSIHFKTDLLDKSKKISNSNRSFNENNDQQSNQDERKISRKKSKPRIRLNRFKKNRLKRPISIVINLYSSIENKSSKITIGTKPKHSNEIIRFELEAINASRLVRRIRRIFENNLNRKKSHNLATKLEKKFDRLSDENLLNDSENYRCTSWSSGSDQNLFKFDDNMDSYNTLPLSKNDWRRKNFYIRRETLDDYLQRNFENFSLTASNSSINSSIGNLISFKTNNPWMNYVRLSGRKFCLKRLTSDYISLYESMFEIIITEKSYIKKLERLLEFKQNCTVLQTFLSQYNFKILFGNSQKLFTINQELYDEFRKSFQRDCFMTSIFDTLTSYLQYRFEPYIDYIRGQNSRDEILADRNLSLALPNEIKQMQSLFIAPMQRITRYPLLLKSILERLNKIQIQTETESFEWKRLHQRIKKCYETAKQFSIRCDQSIRKLIELEKLIEFRKCLINPKTERLVDSRRELIQQIEIKILKLIRLKNNEDREEFREIKIRNPTLILFTDRLMLASCIKTKKRRYELIECEQLDRVELCKEEPSVTTPNCNDSFVENGLNNYLTIFNEEQSAIVSRQRRLFWIKEVIDIIKFFKTKEILLYHIIFYNYNQSEQFFYKFKELKARFLIEIEPKQKEK
ncbi:retinitis pigmentosa 1-like 1 protein [Sarcoptes scabiei]|nr:retinitis pigmentosa 1-like 1 protein [Sarcoptes scabiei]